jgi:hypothetical protein
MVKTPAGVARCYAIALLRLEKVTPGHIRAGGH